jgi:glucose/arabinose dehydrogenase
MPTGQLWATNNGMDERGSRPVEGDPDAMFQINRGDWYGWPDYSIGRPVNQEEFEVDGVIPQLVLAEHPPLSDFAEGFAFFDEHVSANKFDFSSSSDFKFEGDAFVAETGSIPGGSGAPDLRGYRVTRVDMDNGDVSVFMDNRSGQPAFATDEDGINKPIDVKVSSREEQRDVRRRLRRVSAARHRRAGFRRAIRDCARQHPPGFGRHSGCGCRRRR